MNKLDINPLIRLTSSGYWMQIDELEKDGKLPAELGRLLKELVNSHLNNTARPTATPHLIELAKQHLQGGIELSDSAMDLAYDVMVYTPNRGCEKEQRLFFILIHKYPEGRMRYLDEV